MKPGPVDEFFENLDLNPRKDLAAVDPPYAGEAASYGINMGDAGQEALANQLGELAEDGLPIVAFNSPNVAEMYRDRGFKTLLNRRMDTAGTRAASRGIKPELIAIANIPDMDAARWFQHHPDKQFVGTEGEQQKWEERFDESFDPSLWLGKAAFFPDEIDPQGIIRRSIVNDLTELADTLNKALGDPDDLLHWDKRFGGTPYKDNKDQIYLWNEANPEPIARFDREHNVSYPLEGLDELLPDFKDITGGKNLRSEGHRILGSPFGSTSKMPGGSQGFPTQLCRVGSTLRRCAGSTCENCYAHDQGKYRLNNKQIAHWRNAAALRMPDEEGTIEYASALANRIPASVLDFGDPRFRMLDSGDLQGRKVKDRARHLSLIADAVKHIMARSPIKSDVWLPTREENALHEYMKVRDWDTAIPESLKVSLSAPYVGQGLDDDANEAAGLPALTDRFRELTSHPQIAPSFVGASGEGIHICPTSQLGGSCQDRGCGACWGGVPISFNPHAHGKKNRPVQLFGGGTLGYDDETMTPILPFNLGIQPRRVDEGL